MTDFRVGIDGYSLKPLGLSPFQMLDWTAGRGGQGVQFSEPPVESGDPAFLRDLRQYAAEKKLYLEWGGGQHIPFDPQTRQPIDIAAINRRAAEQAADLGVAAIRSCSGGLLRWPADAVPTETYLREMAAALRAQRSLLRDLGVILAIETHFEFTTHELVRLFEMCDAPPGDFLGICLDTMNLLTMLEDPVAATTRVLPWVVTTHIKDGAIIETEKGFISFTAEAGAGIVDFGRIFGALGSLNREITLSIEDHGGDFSIPLSDPVFRAKFPDLDEGELGSLRALAARTRQKMSVEGLAVLNRSAWPAICEDRVTRDIRTVRGLARGAGTEPR
jgi:3-oxoisoapionate decarboxylase